MTYDRNVLIEVLTYHHNQTGPPPYTITCTCGYGTRPEHLGHSYPEHLADIYEQSVTARNAVGYNTGHEQ